MPSQAVGSPSVVIRAAPSPDICQSWQINMDNPVIHHDALEFSDGQVVLLTRLCVWASVLPCCIARCRPPSSQGESGDARSFEYRRADECRARPRPKQEPGLPLGRYIRP
jgi:hypothetical protein